MAGSKGIRAGRAFVELSTNNSKLVKGLRSAQRRLKTFGRSVNGMGMRLLGAATAVTAPIIAATMKFASFGDAVNKMSARTGLSAKSVSALGFAAEQSGTDMETLEKGFQGLARFSLNAERGLSTATDSMDDLGFSLADLQGKSPEDQFKVIADKLAAVEDPGRKAALAMSIFGKSGAKLLPLLSSGAAGISALQAEAERLGITLSDEDAQAAADLTDAMNRMKRAMAAAWMNGGAALAEGMIKITNRMASLATLASNYIKENKSLVRTIIAIGSVIGIASGLFLAFGASMFLASAAIGGVITLVGVITSVLAFILSPLGLVISLIAALATWFLKSGVVMEWFGSMFGPLFEQFKEFAEGIANALANGRLAAAAKLAMAAINAVWVWGTAGLLETWHSAMDGLADAFGSFTTLASGSFLAITKMGMEAANTVAGVWAQMQRGAFKTMRKMMGDSDAMIEMNLQVMQQGHGNEEADRLKKIQGMDDAMQENVLIGQEKADARNLAAREARSKRQESANKEWGKAQQEYNEALKTANLPASENGSDLDGMLDKLKDITAGGVGAISGVGVGVGSGVGGSFSALSQLMVPNVISKGDQAIIAAIEKDKEGLD